MDDIKKLPKWAQYEIQKLQNLVEQLKKQVSEMDQKESNVRWNGGLMDYHNLPNNSRVEFFIDSGKRVDVQHWHNGSIRISGDISISVEPQASNTIIVRPIV